MSVLVLIALGCLAATAVLASAEAEREVGAAALRRVQGRAMAWSGVQGVMAELAAQRDRLLDGGTPQLTEEWTLFGDEGRGPRGVVRLVAMGENGEVAVSESAKLDVNTATAEMLAKVPGLDERVAGAIAAARETGPFGSLDELLGVEGVEAAVLFGAGVDDSPESSHLTTFSFDPNVQLGLGPTGEGHRGELRFNLNSPWSERLGRAIARRFGDAVAAAVERIMTGGEEFPRDSAIVRVMRRLRIGPEGWVEPLDAFTASSDAFLAGRIDVRLAPLDVLACIPGIDESAAERLVAARQRIGDDALRSPVWLVTEGILSEEQFERAIDHVTTRSLQWRVRVEAGMASAADIESGAPLRDRVVLDAVIDVSSARPRVAYLRDVTMLEIVRSNLPDVEDRPETGAGDIDPVEEGLEAPVSARVAAAEEASERRRGFRSARLDAAENLAREPFTPALAPHSREEGADDDGGEAEPRDPRLGRWTTGPRGGAR